MQTRGFCEQQEGSEEAHDERPDGQPAPDAWCIIELEAVDGVGVVVVPVDADRESCDRVERGCDAENPAPVLRAAWVLGQALEGDDDADRGEADCAGERDDPEKG